MTANPSNKPQPVFDNQSQLDRIIQYIIPGETLFAVYDCKGSSSGFVGITDQRLIFYDQGMFVKNKTMISIPYHQVIGVAASDDGVIFKTSEIILITAAGRFSFMFRGADKALWAYRFIMHQIMNKRYPQQQG